MSCVCICMLRQGDMSGIIDKDTSYWEIEAKSGGENSERSETGRQGKINIYLEWVEVRERGYRR